MIHYDSQLQYAIAFITKCNSYFTTKSERSLLQNVSSFLLQNATVSLQNVTVITKCDNFITKYGLSLQIATVQYISITPIETGNT